MEDLTKKIEDLKVSDSEKTSNEPPKNNTKERMIQPYLHQ